MTVTEFPNNQTGYKGSNSIFNCLPEINKCQLVYYGVFINTFMYI